MANEIEALVASLRQPTGAEDVTGSLIPDGVNQGYATVERWNREIVKALNDATVRSQIKEHGMDAVPSTQKELHDKILREYALWEKIVKQAGITAE